MPSDKYQIIKHSESETLLIEMKMITGFITGADSKKISDGYLSLPGRVPGIFFGNFIMLFKEI